MDKGAERSLEQMQQTLQQQQVPGLTAWQSTGLLRELADPRAEGRFEAEVSGQSQFKPSDGRNPGDEPVERFAKPMLLAEAPNHIAWTAPASAIAYAGQNLRITVQQDLHANSGQTIATVSGGQVSLFAQYGPVRLIAANGPASLQAHDGGLEVLSEQALTITATDARIDVLAQSKVVLQAGSSAITLEGGDITFSCLGEFKVRAGDHPFMVGENAEPFIPSLPNGAARAARWIALHFQDAETLQAMEGTTYEIHFKGGSVIKGKLNAEGQAHHEPIPAREVEKIVYEPREPGAEDAWPALELIGSIVQGADHG